MGRFIDDQENFPKCSLDVGESNISVSDPQKHLIWTNLQHLPFEVSWPNLLPQRSLIGKNRNSGMISTENYFTK